MTVVPDLKIPSSTKTVQVRIIDTTSRIRNIGLGTFLTPTIKGFETLNCPAYSFLIEHPSGRKVLFDLGVRKDWENSAPALLKRIKNGNWELKVEKHVRDQLEEHGVNGKDIEAVIWSHFHWDHTGDVTTFDKSTALVVGPGFKKAHTPGYPTNEDSTLLEDNWQDRELREITFDQNLKIGNFNAFDFFGDGSFYLLDSPGHAIGHLCALARVKTSGRGDHFILMGGDACHHGGEFRPSKYMPLPTGILPDPLDRHSVMPCPGELFEELLRDGDRTKPFFAIYRGTGAVTSDPEEAEKTIEKVQEADADDKIFVVMAHDETIMGVVDFFPKYANDFVQKGWVKGSQWAFLKDFAVAIKQTKI